jgi:hypothetical protein
MWEGLPGPKGIAAGSRSHSWKPLPQLEAAPTESKMDEELLKSV